MTRFASPHRNYCIYLESPKRKLENNEVTHQGGTKCQFVNGTYSTDDNRVAALLRKHPACGTAFHEMKAEPAKPEGDGKQKAA